MKKLTSILAVFTLVFTMFSCSKASPNATQEAVWVKQPILFGHGGVDMTPVSTGLQWGVFTSHPVYFTITPVQYNEKFDDIFSDDNTPLDFNTFIRIKVEKGKAPVLLKNYGENWYVNNIQTYYRNRVMDYVSKYSPFDLISNREVSTEIDRQLLKDMQNYVSSLSKKAELPITIISVTTGKAKPNDKQLDEMNRTAMYIQEKRSMEQKAIAEQARAKAEQNKALADRAYMKEMNLTAAQYIQLKWVDVIANKQGANIDVLVGNGETPMWNIRR